MASVSALLAYGGKRRIKSKKTKTKYEVTNDTPSASSHGLNATSSAVVVAPPPKVVRAFEDAIRRRDFQHVLWMIANDDVDAAFETSSGETALLAAVAAKNVDALHMLVNGYARASLRTCACCCLLGYERPRIATLTASRATTAASRSTARTAEATRR